MNATRTIHTPTLHGALSAVVHTPAGPVTVVADDQPQDVTR